MRDFDNRRGALPQCRISLDAVASTGPSRLSHVVRRGDATTAQVDASATEC
jgi:hypothetical protein